MAESNQVPQLSNKRKRETELEDLKVDEIRDLSHITKTDSSKQIHGCDICMVKSVFSVSFYLCYICSVYVCEKCSKMHDQTHGLVKRKHEENERSEKANNSVLGIRGEFEANGEDLHGEFVKVIGQVNVRHELDERDCFISGFSGMDNKMWVAVDHSNYCIKIFCSVSKALLRYIKFGSRPDDVTEIKVEQKSTDPDSASGSNTDISGTARDEPDKHRLLAVTFWHIKQIWFIDVNKTPALKIKTINMQKECRAIEFNEDKFFTLCKKNTEPESRWAIYILSTEGEELKVVQIPGLSSSHILDLAVYKEHVYLAFWSDNKVFCINVEDGKTISELTLEGSGPRGVSVDHNSGVVYVCGFENDKVYKLSPDLHEFEPLSLDSGYTEVPYRLCFINNKLYITHWSSSLRNVVTVVQLLT